MISAVCLVSRAGKRVQNLGKSRSGMDQSRRSRVTQRSHLNRITQIPSVTGKLGITHENLMSRVGRASQGMLGQSGRAVPLGNVYELELVW